MPYIFEPQQYASLLEDKVSNTLALFKSFTMPAFDIFKSPTQHFRMRAEFRMWHDEKQQLSPYPVMFGGPSKKQIKALSRFPIAAKPIDFLVANLTAMIHHNPVLTHKLFQIECLSSRRGETLLSMIYHRPLDDEWRIQAQALQQQLCTHHPIKIIGRSRKQKVVLEQDYICETFKVGAITLHYKQYENSFTQPNASINEAMLNWVYNNTKNISGDALELYCGNGNFTAVLAQNFDRVIATEVVKTAVQSARTNMSLNKISNTTIVRLSSEEFTQAMAKQRRFKRLSDIELDQYCFSCVLVDPPRSGLDQQTCAMIADYHYIIYISCNPNTLVHNLHSLSNTHKVVNAALFDQFPYTEHIECALILKRR